MNNNQQFYLYLDGSYLVDLNTLEYETIDSGVSAESCWSLRMDASPPGSRRLPCTNPKRFP